jgi:hypothetical protein
MRLVVATRLQTQHPSFWLHTSSNTQSVLTNDAYESFANSDEGMCFAARPEWIRPDGLGMFYYFSD